MPVATTPQADQKTPLLTTPPAAQKTPLLTTPPAAQKTPLLTTPPAAQKTPSSVSTPSPVEPAALFQQTPNQAIDAKAFAGEISKDAAKKRLTRFFAPRKDGSYLVPTNIVEMWKDQSKRDELIEEFAKAKLDKDCTCNGLCVKVYTYRRIMFVVDTYFRHIYMHISTYICMSYTYIYTYMYIEM